MAAYSGFLRNDSTCPTCNKTLKSPEGVQQHMRDKHGALKEEFLLPDFLNGSPDDLESFVAENLQPTIDGNKIAKHEIKRLVNLLQHNTGFSVARVIKAGSFGKGTQVKAFADLDCVVILNDIENVEDRRLKGPKILDDLKRQIKSNWKATVEIDKKTEYSEYSLQFAMKIDVDLLPTFPIKPDQEDVYRDIMLSAGNDQPYYSVALSQYQVEFVRKQPTRVKNLIRLVKYWNKEVVKSVAKCGWRYPTSYPMELITIHVWEKAGRPANFDMAVALKAVLRRLVNYRDLNVFWTDNYDSTMASQALQMQRMIKPILLDPTNPRNNVLSASSPGALEHVAEIARGTMQKPLLKNVVVTWPWG